MKFLYSFVLTSIILFIPLKAITQTIVASFEDQKELQNTRTTKGVVISLSTDFPALQAYSCKAVFPENGGAFYLNNIRPITRETLKTAL
jgi:hypothetical protein